MMDMPIPFVSKVFRRMTGLHQLYRRKVSDLTSFYIARHYLRDWETELFEVVEFEIRSRCNSSCSFCAASVQFDTRPDTLIPGETFKKVIDELSEIEYTGRIAFHVNNEPLLDKRLPEFVRYARQKCPKAHIHIMTNGIL